jgi:hypothetical protein
MDSGCIGIDWGTYSSKWCYTAADGNVVVGRIWDSRVWREDDDLVMYPLELRYQGQFGEEQLKRKLIFDPDQPFWEGERHRLKTTLGEAVVFSLLALLSDARETLTTRGISLAHSNVLPVRFSHPNWIEPESIPSLQNYRDAVVVALSGFFDVLCHGTPEGAIKAPIQCLREFVKDNKQISGLPSFPPAYSYDEYQACATGAVGTLSWALVFESCAAGFPYIVSSPAGLVAPWIRKILVVDIGAGSTDCGYMLRTIQHGKNEGKPLLIWLPSAPAFERAGNWLTDQILADWRNQGQTQRTKAEAEDYKTSGVTDWYHKPFVKEWCNSITERVEHYMRNVRDEIRLPRDPGLEIVITGGSSAVKPIGEHILGGVIFALTARGISPNLIKATTIVGPPKQMPGGGYTDVQYAQLAVCLGASHPGLTQFKHYPNGLREPTLA